MLRGKQICVKAVVGKEILSDQALWESSWYTEGFKNNVYQYPVTSNTFQIHLKLGEVLAKRRFLLCCLSYTTACIGV